MFKGTVPKLYTTAHLQLAVTSQTQPLVQNAATILTEMFSCQCRHKALTIEAPLWADTAVCVVHVVLHAFSLVARGRVTQHLPILTARAREAVGARALEVVH